MRVLFPNVHVATRRLLRRVGFTVKESNAGCCGALHAHNGHLDESHRMAEQLFHAMPGDLPIIVNSAGCGSFLKESSLPPAPEGEGAKEWGSGRVFDASEFLFEQGLAETLGRHARFEKKVTYHDACHLAHGQKVWLQPRELLQDIPGIEFVELEESDRCCGSAGIYNVLQPKLARELLERKWRFIERSGAEVVALGNPGCHAWVAQAAREHGGRVRVLHTLELLEESLSEMDPGRA